MKKVILSLAFCLSICCAAFAQQWVEVCGIKWATGNLRCHNGKYEISSAQWCRNAIQQKEDPHFIYNFQFGWTEVTYKASNYFYNKKCESIAGDSDWDICTDKLGKNWRLPTKEEFKILEKKASRAKACYEYKPGYWVTGIYYYTPVNGKREVYKGIGKKERVLTDDDLKHGLFLPNAGLREAEGDFILHSTAEPYKIIIPNGYYWSGSLSKGKPYYLEQRCTGDISVISVSPSLTVRANYGLSIRPVYVGD